VGGDVEEGGVIGIAAGVATPILRRLEDVLDRRVAVASGRREVGLVRGNKQTAALEWSRQEGLVGGEPLVDIENG
jgi:hypothetical protein